MKETKYKIKEVIGKTDPLYTDYFSTPTQSQEGVSFVGKTDDKLTNPMIVMERYSNSW